MTFIYFPVFKCFLKCCHPYVYACMHVCVAVVVSNLYFILTNAIICSSLTILLMITFFFFFALVGTPTIHLSSHAFRYLILRYSLSLSLRCTMFAKQFSMPAIFYFYMHVCVCVLWGLSKKKKKERVWVHNYVRLILYTRLRIKYRKKVLA